MGRLTSDRDVVNDNIVAARRIRVNRSAPLALSTTWQTIDFNGTSNLNVNTFPMMENGARKIAWDAVNKKFVAQLQPGEERNYLISLYPHVTCVLRNVDLQLRYFIPAPTPFYFPFPDGRQYQNVFKVENMTDYARVHVDPLYTNDLLRQYGMHVQMRVDASLLGTATLANCAMIIYSAR